MNLALISFHAVGAGFNAVEHMAASLRQAFQPGTPDPAKADFDAALAALLARHTALEDFRVKAAAFIEAMPARYAGADRDALVKLAREIGGGQ